MNNQRKTVLSPVTDTWAGMRPDGVENMDRKA